MPSEFVSVDISRTFAEKLATGGSGLERRSRGMHGTWNVEDAKALLESIQAALVRVHDDSNGNGYCCRCNAELADTEPCNGGAQ